LRRNSWLQVNSGFLPRKKRKTNEPPGGSIRELGNRTGGLKKRERKEFGHEEGEKS